MEKLIEIKNPKKIIFVGDTHGDFEATRKVIEKYLKEENIVVFLGDYVDRGPHSKENLDFLLKVKKDYPENLYLLQGNHEGHRILPFSPAEFWESLSEKEYKKYSLLVEKFPLAIVTKEIIALHGALPDLQKVEDFEKIKLGDENWFRICWGDFSEEIENFEVDFLTGRPKFGKNYFFEIMERFKKKILIRSHQPDAPLFLFENRCLTIFTSSFYSQKRLIAIANFSKNIETAKDLQLVEI